LDEHSAQVTLRNDEQTVSGKMSFDATGRPTNFNAQRFREVDGKYVYHSWSVPMTAWEAPGGLNIPVRGLVTWNLPEGDLPYYEWNITEVDYNRR
jgi:hypothetical protein